MKKSLNKILFGGLLYNFIELLWRKRTHYSMTITGGIAFLGIDYIEKKYKCAKIKKSALCALLITALELIAGLIWNRKKNIWDYSERPLNFKGYVCLGYSIMWFLLSFPARAISRRFD